MTDSAPRPDEVFLDHRALLRRWKLLVTVVAAVVLVLGAVQAVRTARGSAADAVADYFAALADRDVDAALALVADADTARGAAGATLVTGAVLADGRYAPPSDWRTTGVAARGNVTVVDVRYTVDGLEYDDAFSVRRADGWTARLRGRWELVNGVRAVTFGQAPAEVEANGVRVAALDDQGRPATVPALLGAYQLGAPADHPVWQAQPVKARVTHQTPVVEVPMTVHPPVREHAEQRVRAQLDACAAEPVLAPPGCPFGYPQADGAEQVRWEITRYPELTITGPGATVHSDEGEAVVTGHHPTWNAFEVTVSFTVTGELEVGEQPDQVSFVPTD